MKKHVRFTRNRLSSAITLACLSSFSIPAVAGSGSCVDGANVIDGAEVTTCTLDVDGDSVRVTADGSITAAVGVRADAGTFGEVRNDGTITATGAAILATDSTLGRGLTNTGTLDADNAGIYVGSTSIQGNISNSGSIDADDNGIYLNDSSVSGNIVNSGSVYSYYAEGIMVVGGSTVSGSIINTGTLYANSGSGIYVNEGSSISGSITNSGTIDGSDSGIYVGNNSSVGGNISNSGGIDSSDSGIYVGSGSSVTGNITNSGTIDSSDAGIRVDGAATVSGSIFNTGTIDASDNGIYVNSGSSVAGDIRNSGLLDTSDHSIIIAGGSTVSGSIINTGTMDSSDNGFYINSASTVAGDIRNSGLLDTNDSGISIENGSTLSGGIINTGSIDSSDYGIYVNNGSDVAGDITNSGYISSSNDSGIYVNNGATVAGSITNTGTILGDDSGIYISNSATVQGSITNSGYIYADDYHAIQVNNASVSGDLINRGFMYAEDETGIYVANGASVTGSLVNSGTIEAYDNGIYVGNANVDGDIDNSGIIFGDDTAIYVDESATVGGAIRNTGRMEADIGIYVGDSDIVGGILNSGVIESEDHGIYINSSSSLAASVGGITNSGVISSEDSAAVYAYDSSIDSIENNGVITSEFGPGLYVEDGEVLGDVVNNGLIRTEDTDDDYGVYIEATIGGTVTNNGEIDGGVYVDGADFTNNGLINIHNFDSEVYSGDYIQTGSGVLQLSALNTSDYGDLYVFQNAVFESGAAFAVNLQDGHTLVAGDTLSAVVSTSGSVTAGTLQVLDNSVGLFFSADVGASEIDLVAASTGFASVEEAMRIAGFNAALPGALSIDDAIAADTSGDIAFAFGSISDADDMADAVESALPALSGGLAQASIGAANGVASAVRSRQLGNSGIASGDEVMLGKNVWLSVFDGTTEQDDRDGISGYDMDTSGFALGADTETDSGWTVGIAAASIESELESDIAGNTGRQEVDSDTWIAMLYGSYSFSDITSMNVKFGGGQTDNDASRRIFTGATALSSYESDFRHGSAEIVREIELGDSTRIAPYLGLEYTKVNVEEYEEAGAGAFNLSVRGSEAEDLIFRVGAIANQDITDSLVLTGEIAYGHDAQADPTTVTSSFAGGGQAFTTKAMTQDDTVINLGVGAEYTINDSAAVSLSYDLESREDYDDEYTALKVNWKF